MITNARHRHHLAAAHAHLVAFRGLQAFSSTSVLVKADHLASYHSVPCGRRRPRGGGAAFGGG